MEVESFDDETIASYMNEHFISIKVDRELLPDIDAIYMTATMLMTGSGGWPMNTFLTADSKPFIGGTYFSPQKFYELLQCINNAWRNKPDMIMGQADLISKEINRVMLIKKTGSKNKQ